jgi:flagellar motor switch protein FliG
VNGADKAAILLLFLGPDATGKVYEHLDDDEIKRISQSMTSLGYVSRQTIEEVVQEFNHLTDPESGFFSQGEEFVRKVLEQALGSEKAEALLQEIYTSTRADLANILGNMDSRTVANFLSQEHPQTVAVILAKLRPKQSADVISLLPYDMQAEVVLRIADVEQVSPDILTEIEDVVRKELTSLGGLQRYKVGGLEKVVEVFGYLDRSREKQILDRLDEINPPLADVIRKHLFTFDDVFNLDDRGIQTIMREVNSGTLTLAIKTCSDDLKEKIFRNISSRAAQMIKEDLEVMGPVRLSDVEKAQSEVVKVASRLEEEGKIVIAGRGGEDVLV